MEEDIKFKIKKFFDKELEQEWIYLSKQCEVSIFQTYEWQKIWNKNINEENNYNLYIICIYSREKIIAIIPFVKYESFNIQILTMTGFPFADYCDCLIDQDFFTQNQKTKFSVTKYLMQIEDIDLIKIDKVKDDSNLFYLLNKENFRQDNFKSYEIIRKNDFEELFPKKIENDTKRQIKRLREIGNLSFETVKTKEDKEKMIDFFFEKKEQQLKNTNNWNYLKYKKNKNFISNMYSSSKNTHLSWLLLNEKIIAAHLGYYWGNKIFYIFPVYDPNYSKFSPGNILLYYLIDKFFSESGIIVDFTIGDETYKTRISNKNNNIFYNYISLTLKGKIALSFLTILNSLKKIKIIKRMHNKIRY